MDTKEQELPSSPSTTTSPPLKVKKWFFLKNGDSRPPLVNGQNPVFTDMGDGVSYFITRDEKVADAVRLAIAKFPFITEIGEEGFYAKKAQAESQQKRVEQRVKEELAFRSPGMQPQVARDPLSHPLIDSAPPVPAAAAAVDPSVAHSTATTLYDEPPKLNMFPVKAEPMPPEPFD